MQTHPTPSRPSRKLLRKLSAGFSMIEILVAMTILTIIVLIVAEIFQQTGLAWTLGLRRADEQTVTRAIVGTLTRDLSMMVDPNNFIVGPAEADEQVRSDALNSGNLSELPEGAWLSGNSLAFWVLKPSDPTAQKPESRELAFVEYSAGSKVRRTESRFSDNDSGSLSTGTDTEFDLGSDGSLTFETLNVSDKGFTSLYDLPGLTIKVRPTTPVSVNDYEIAVASCGPDGKWGTDDDIRPWVEGEDSN